MFSFRNSIALFLEADRSMSPFNPKIIKSKSSSTSKSIVSHQFHYIQYGRSGLYGSVAT